jgi:hypothetical protein
MNQVDDDDDEDKSFVISQSTFPRLIITLGPDKDLLYYTTVTRCDHSCSHASCRAMAQSVNPWLASYLISIAEQHGANIIAIPRFNRRKMVQLTEVIKYHLLLQFQTKPHIGQWLTFGDNDLLWATISDKQHSIPIRFTKTAIAEYNRFAQF